MIIVTNMIKRRGALFGGATIGGAALALVVSCSEKAPVPPPPGAPRPPVALFGEWVQDFPEERRGHRIVIRPDGSASGPAVAPPLDTTVSWVMLTPGNYSELCFKGKHFNRPVCSGFRIQGGTLTLGNQEGSRFHRSIDDQHAEPRTATKE